MITLTGGHIQGIDSSPVPNGSILFQLNLDATVVAAPGGFVPASTEIVFQFDKTGNLVQPAKLYSNVELNPQNASGLGTYYFVTIFDANGARLSQTPMAWQFTAITGSTVDISQMVPIIIAGTIIYYPSTPLTTADLPTTGTWPFNGTISGNVTFTGEIVDSLGSPGSPGFFLKSTGAGVVWAPVSAAGSVTSVAMTGDGTIFATSVPGSPITSAGTFVPTLLPQTANTFLAGPTSGPSAAPIFRNLQNSDLPTSGVTAGSYTSTNLTVNAQGIITAASNGSGFTNPMTTLGDMLYENATPAAARLAGSTSATKMFLTQTGTGVISAAPAWSPIAIGDLPTSGTWPFTGTISGAFSVSSTLTVSGTLTSSGGSVSGSWAGNPILTGNPQFSGEVLDGAGSPGTLGLFLKSTGTGVVWAVATGSGLASRTQVSKTTGTLAPQAIESGTVTLAKTFALIYVQVSGPARVRLYSTAATRNADISRGLVLQSPGTQNGIITDLYLDTSDKWIWLLSPAAYGSNGDGTPASGSTSTTIYYNITNIGSTSAAITATFTFLQLEL